MPMLFCRNLFWFLRDGRTCGIESCHSILRGRPSPGGDGGRATPSLMSKWMTLFPRRGGTVEAPRSHVRESPTQGRGVYKGGHWFSALLYRCVHKSHSMTMVYEP